MIVKAKGILKPFWVNKGYSDVGDKVGACI